MSLAQATTESQWAFAHHHATEHRWGKVPRDPSATMDEQRIGRDQPTATGKQAVDTESHA